MITILAALTENRVIGKNNKLPWYLPDDLRRFRKLTTHHTVVMGRKTFESILGYLGSPLPNRKTIVLSESGSWPEWPDVEVCRSLEELRYDLKGRDEMIFIIGGMSLFHMFIGEADRLELTIVHGDYEGDAFFPPYKHLLGPRFTVTKMQDMETHTYITYEKYENSVKSIGGW